MGQIKNNTYTLYIYNGGVDSQNSDAKIEIRYNNLTKIDNNGTKLNLSLFGLSFHRKIYEPGLIKAEIQITVVPDDNGNIKIPDINILENYFIRKKVELKVSVPDKDTAPTYTLAENYYIHEIHPLYERSASNTYIYVKLTIRSMDNLMRLNKFCQAYLGRQLRKTIVTDGIKDYNLNVGETKYKIELSDKDVLQHLSYGTDEFIQPYLVQYNESFYDFVVRIANRCGEFVYFEDGCFHMGIDTSMSPINVENYSRITYQNIIEGPLDIEDYTHDSVNRNKYDSDGKDECDIYTYRNEEKFTEITVIKKQKNGEDVYSKEVYKWFDSSDKEFNDVQESLVKLSGEKYKIYEDSGREIMIYCDNNKYKKSYLDCWDDASESDFPQKVFDNTQQYSIELEDKKYNIFIDFVDSKIIICDENKECRKSNIKKWEKTGSEYFEDAQKSNTAKRLNDYIYIFKKTNNGIYQPGFNKIKDNIDKYTMVYYDQANNTYRKCGFNNQNNWIETNANDIVEKLNDDIYVYNGYIIIKNNRGEYQKICLEKTREDSTETYFNYIRHNSNCVRRKSTENINSVDTDKKGTYNIEEVEKTEIYPQNKVYNAEVVADEFFMPLYRNQFNDYESAPIWDNIYWKHIWSIKGDVISHVVDSLSDDNVIDMVLDNTFYLAELLGQSIKDWDSNNKKGNEIINTWESETAKMAVPFASNNVATWTTLEYYHDIKKNEDSQERQMVCVDMDSEILFEYEVTDSNNKKEKVKKEPRIGDIVKLYGNNRNYIVVEIEMHSDQEWQRRYDGYNYSQQKGSDCRDSILNENVSKSRLRFYAIPATEGNIFYPPVLPSGAFRKSDPQHAIVVDNKDPKLQGRVRIRYPWQSTYTTNKDDSAKEKILKEAATPWIRMVTPMATNGGGMYFKPEKGDEVLVNFENGNIERPYVVGTLYSKNNHAPDGNRIIQSANGHYIKMDDPTDTTKLLKSTLPIIDFIKEWDLLPDINIEATKQMLGGITISDANGLYSIKMSSDQRKVEIESAFGDVKINAFTGITISAPNGNVKIEGKNIDICAGNRLTLKSGENLEKSEMFYEGGSGLSGNDFGKTLINRVDDVLGGIIDLKIVRTLMEAILKPINGTLQIHSHAFLLLEAGDCNAEIPNSAYKSRALTNKNLSISSNTYKTLAYIATSIDNNISRCAKEIGKLYNRASRKLAALYVKNDLGAKSIFKDGWGQIANKSADEFVKDAMESKVYMKENDDLFTTIIRVKDKDVFSANKYMKKLEWNKLGEKVGWKTDFESKVKDAYKAVSALKSYCEMTSNMFKIYCRFDDKSIYKLLNSKFNEVLKDVDIRNLDWVKKINEIKKGSNINYAYFVDNFTAKTVDINYSNDYTEGIKKFNRCLLYNILGNSSTVPVPGSEPINKTDFLKNKNSKISINVDKSSIPPKMVASISDIINNENNGWANYINSLKIDEGKEDFLYAFVHSFEQLLDKKILTLAPERDVWRADFEGKILMADSSDTITINHQNGNGVSLKSESNVQLIKDEEQENYLYNQLLTLGE